MSKKYLIFLVIGGVLSALGIALAKLTGAMAWTWILIAGVCLIGVGIAEKLPKLRCPSCGHRFNRFRYDIRESVGREPTLPCPQCGVIVPLRGPK